MRVRHGLLVANPGHIVLRPVALAHLFRLGNPLPICVVAIGGWRATELFGVIDPDQLIPDDDEAPDPDGLGLFLRICLLLFLGLIFWQAMLVP